MENTAETLLTPYTGHWRSLELARKVSFSAAPPGVSVSPLWREGETRLGESWVWLLGPPPHPRRCPLLEGPPSAIHMQPRELARVLPPCKTELPAFPLRSPSPNLSAA